MKECRKILPYVSPAAKSFRNKILWILLIQRSNGNFKRSVFISNNFPCRKF